MAFFAISEILGYALERIPKGFRDAQSPLAQAPECFAAKGREFGFKGFALFR
jgi:hypothetical protein